MINQKSSGTTHQTLDGVRTKTINRANQNRRMKIKLNSNNPAGTALTTELMTAFTAKINGSDCEMLKDNPPLLEYVLKKFVSKALASLSD